MKLTYADSINYLLNLIDHERTSARLPRQKRIYDLQIMNSLLESMDNPHKDSRTIHVAGTKGKGSTSSMCDSILNSSGYTTGFYSSPHLHTFRERIRLGTNEITEVLFSQLVDAVKPYSERITQGDVSLFEFMTAMAFSCFSQENVDFQTIEVGLGGRLDATNVVVPEIAIITSISLDHTAILGDSIEQIAFEKAGIIKPGCEVVISPQEEAVYGTLNDICESRGVRSIIVGKDVTWECSGQNDNRQQATINGRLGKYEIDLPLLGDFQLENASSVLAAMEILMERGAIISEQSIYDGFHKVSWPCRMEYISDSPAILLDGAHNPYSMKVLLQNLKSKFRNSNLIFITGFSKDKNVSEMVNLISEMDGIVITTESRHPRSLAFRDLAQLFMESGMTQVYSLASVNEAVKEAIQLVSDDTVIVVPGSLFVAAEAREYILDITPEIYPDLLPDNLI